MDNSEEYNQKIGRIATPSGKEATTDTFYFWVARNTLVEKTQIICAISEINGQKYKFFAVIVEVYRQSRKADILEEVDEADGNPDFESPFPRSGISYAKANILRTEPRALTVPLDGSDVYLCGESGTAKAYGSDGIDHPLAVGAVKNGGEIVAGKGLIDLDYLLGMNGGHLNVNGVAGVGTKSSFLMFTIYMLLAEAKRQAEAMRSAVYRLRVVPVILNVKGYDLFHIHEWNAGYHPTEHKDDWAHVGNPDPHPFFGTRFFAPQAKNVDVAVTIHTSASVDPYSWSLSDLIERGLLMYLFADEDSSNDNFGALVLDIETHLTDEIKDARRLKTGDGYPETLDDLLEWINHQANSSEDTKDERFKSHHPGTWRKLYRRLLKLLIEGDGVLRRSDRCGKPLDLSPYTDTCAPLVVDLFSLNRNPSLQRFVVATLINQMIDQKSHHVVDDELTYLIALDELNRFAPHGAKDTITQLIERVAAEMRSQGIILLGAQQQASKVSEKVVENAAIRVLGRSGTLELSTPIWRFLSDGARRLAANLRPEEKLVSMEGFREPLLVRVPYPAWAMKSREIGKNPDQPNQPARGATSFTRPF